MSDFAVDVKAPPFNAAGDGSTDDTAAIQAAIDSIRDTGGTVFFPVGTYIIKKPGIQLVQTSSHPYNNITLKGTGYASCLKAGEAIGLNNGTVPLSMVLFEGINTTDFSLLNCGIRELRLSGFDTSTLAGPLVLYNRTNNGFLIDSYLDTNSTEGAYWNSPTSDVNGVCTGNHATMIGGWGVSPPAGPLSAYNVNTNNALIANNYADHCGFAIEAVGSGMVITGNQFSYMGHGVTNTWSVAMSLASTYAGTRFLVANNLVQYASCAIEISATSGTGDVLIIGNVFENIDQVLSVDNSIPITIRGNSFYDTVTAGTGSSALIDHGRTATGPLIIDGNTFIAGPTGKWAYGVLIRDAVNFDVIQNNRFIGDGVAADVFATGSTSTGWNTQFIDNVITPLTMANSVARYLWQGVSFNKTNTAGIDNGTVFSTLRPSVIRTTAAPTIGTWSVGDVAINTAPTAGGTLQWVCTTAGTPGTWTSLTLS